MKAEYRRSGLWAVLGFGLVVLLGVFLRLEQLTGLAALFVASIVLWLYVQTWRLRIDSVGLARRRLGFWSYWTWDQFAAGYVRAGASPLSFRCAVRPWWDRWLILEFVEPETAPAEIARLLRALIPPQPAEADQVPLPVPTEVVIGLGFAGRLQITPQGVEFQRRRASRSVKWDDVLILRLIREQNQQATLFRLELQLRAGDRISGTVNSLRIDGRRIWGILRRNADWPRRLAVLTPPRCWQVFNTVGELQSRAEGEFRLAYWRQKLTRTRRLRLILPPVCLVVSGVAFVTKLVAAGNAQFIPPWWKPVALVCLALTMVMLPFVMWVLLHAIAQTSARIVNATEAVMSRLPATDDAPVASR